MRTIKIILTVLAIALVASCETSYRMVTTLDSGGKVYREIYAYGKTPFMNGDTSDNPFFFTLTPDWHINRLDTAVSYIFLGDTSNFNVKISKEANSIEQYSKEIQCSEGKQSLAMPEESLVNKFRWFYTYYSFKAVYKKLQYDFPISIDDYLSKDEQILWTQGGWNTNNYNMLNGYEMNSRLKKIDDKFSEWAYRNCFEINFKAIKALTTGYDLNTNKKTIYKAARKAIAEFSDVTPKAVCTVLDTVYKTTYFSQLYKDNEKTLKNKFETATAFVNQLNYSISYELVVSGKIISTNTPVINCNTLTWKVDGMRLLFDDYTLSAEYRVANKWAFVVSGLIIILAVAALVWRHKK